MTPTEREGLLRDVELIEACWHRGAKFDDAAQRLAAFAREQLADTTAGDDGDKCQGCKGDARPMHSCPYKSEIHNDEDTLCNCYESCTHECAMDI